MISFTIHSEPIAQPRHNIGKIGGFARAYIPASHAVHKFKLDVKEAAMKAWGKIGQPVLCPLEVRAVFVMGRPKKYQGKKYDTGRLWYDRQPDIDNFMKSLFDGITGIIWANDSQVCDARCQKYYAAVGEEPHIEVLIKEIM